MDRNRDGVRVRDRASNPRAHARRQHIVRNILAAEEVTAFSQYPLRAMTQITRCHTSRALEQARGMRHLIARERAPPPSSSRVEHKHQTELGRASCRERG